MAYKHVEDRRRARAERQRKIVEWVTAYKASACCAHCGEQHPACLHYHHRDASEKDFSISHAVFHGWGIARIQREIEKCDVLCANCHAKHHWEQRILIDNTTWLFSFIEELDSRNVASQTKQQTDIA